jgi:hypothetical protein
MKKVEIGFWAASASRIPRNPPAAQKTRSVRFNVGYSSPLDKGEVRRGLILFQISDFRFPIRK